MKEIQIWADSFHEGQWAVDNLCEFFPLSKKEYIYGFIPIYIYEIANNEKVIFKVFGSYNSWSPMPKPIMNLISYGKPDVVYYDPIKDKIILAVEETAAVPTGNQALQRCERVYGSACNNIPFVYLLGEYGIHTDGSVRRTSIWPTLLGLKLSLQFKTPSFSLHYSDLENPEDYTSGKGLSILFRYTALLIKKNFNLLDDKEIQELIKLEKSIIKIMNNFIVEQCPNIVKYFPWRDYLKTDECSEQMALKLLSGKCSLEPELFVWPKANIIYNDPTYQDIRRGFLAQDDFLEYVEEFVDQKKAYVISSGAGSRPQPKKEILSWINSQKVKNDQVSSFMEPIKYTLDFNNLPISPKGYYHLTTSKNITYFLDNLQDLSNAHKKAFNRSTNLSDVIIVNNDMPVFLYIINAIKPNRIFGDPYTGQFSAFSNIFCYDCMRNKTRHSIVYMPYNTAAYFFKKNGTFVQNKGIKNYIGLADAIITNNGYIVTFNERGKIHV